MASFTFRRQLTIEWGHCDPAGIVFNPRFFEFFDASSWLLFEAALGVKAQDLASTYHIVGIRAGRCPRQFPQTDQIRRHDRDRLARGGIPPLELRCRASPVGQRHAGGRGRRIPRLGGAQQGRPRQDRGRADPARRDRQVRLALSVGDLHVFEVARLVVDADLRRRDPAGELGRLELRLHQALDEILVR